MNRNTVFLNVIALLLCTFLFASCNSAPSYDDQLHELADEFNKQCPMPQENGTTIKDCSYNDGVLTYHYGVSPDILLNMDVIDRKQKNVQALNPKIAGAIKNLNGKIRYVYMAEEDSVEITIVSSEL